MNTTQDNAELLKKIGDGLKLAIQKLYEQKATNNEMAWISEDGVIKHLPARELLERRKKK